MERVAEPTEARLGEPRRIERHLDLEGLAHVAEVRGEGEGARWDGRRVLGEPATGLRGHVPGGGGEVRG